MALEAYKLGWIDVRRTNISGLLCLSRPETVSGSSMGYRVCFSHFLSILPLTAATHHFLPFFKYVITEMPPVQLMGPALGSSGSILELAGPAVSNMELLLVSSHKGYPCSTPRYQNLDA